MFTNSTYATRNRVFRDGPSELEIHALNAPQQRNQAARPRHANRPPTAASIQEKDYSNYDCSFCGEKGHIRRQCALLTKAAGILKKNNATTHGHSRPGKNFKPHANAMGTQYPSKSPTTSHYARGHSNFNGARPKVAAVDVNHDDDDDDDDLTPEESAELAALVASCPDLQEDDDDHSSDDASELVFH